MTYATIYRTEFDHSDNGVSSKYWNMEVIEQVEKDTYETAHPEQVLVLIRQKTRTRKGSSLNKRSWYLHPLTVPHGAHYEFGGNYAKLDESISKVLVPIYDKLVYSRENNDQ